MSKTEAIPTRCSAQQTLRPWDKSPAEGEGLHHIAKSPLSAHLARWQDSMTASYATLKIWFAAWQSVCPQIGACFYVWPSNKGATKLRQWARNELVQICPAKESSQPLSLTEAVTYNLVARAYHINLQKKVYHELLSAKERRNECFFMSLSKLMPYRRELETWNREEIPFILSMVPTRDLSVAEGA